MFEFLNKIRRKVTMFILKRLSDLTIVIWAPTYHKLDPERKAKIREFFEYMELPDEKIDRLLGVE